MITFKKFGKKIKITNADWKGLRARFTPHNAIRKGSRYIIEKGCPFCPKYQPFASCECKGCPLAVFSHESKLGCERFFGELFLSLEFNAGDIAEISWWKEDDIHARIQLYKLQGMMDKIEGLKENQNDKSKA